ncbi:MAG TPA: hypothetical protein DEB73_02230 [Candidatus Magasanikbacteria bacterium]|nr:hypothetical protein [Candidatus Magasanikbacteria bacterium]HBX15798.1 hypothetical protein [Candidatus Magasanikbacteria bacterium]
MKFKKIILITALLGGIFFSAQVKAEEIEINFTPILPKGKCLGDSMCFNNTYCDLQFLDQFKKAKLYIFCPTGSTCNLADELVPSSFTVPLCMPKFEIGKECNKNEQCLSNYCSVGQGNEKKCMEQETNAGYLKFAPIAPTLEIKIPTLQPFTTEGLEKPDAEGNIYFPFIGQYIVGIYKWMLLVAGIIATIMIILGGFTYLTSGGNATQAGAGKERITSAIFGLILLLGSYMLLYLINPGLVEFRSLKIKVIERTPIESMVFEDHNPSAGSTKGLEATDYDKTFQDFANCAGIDWRIYKAIAYKESGLNPTVTGGKTGKFIGLFQVFQPYCKNALSKVKWDAYCDSPGLTNPMVNTAYTALLIDKNATKIAGTCASAPIQDKLAMIYIGHNCGPGALGSLLKTSCNFNKWLAAPPSNCSLGKMNFAKSVVGVMQQLGVSSIQTAPENFDLTKCPFNNGATPL